MDAKASDAEMTMTIQVIRKETGKVEEYVLKSIKENEHGDNTHNNIPQSGSGFNR